jgi:hypothetical protein
VLPCYLDSDGQRFLDSLYARPLPLRGTRQGRFTNAEVRELLNATIPVRAAAWLRRPGPQTAVPDGWSANPWLRDLILIPQQVDRDGLVSPASIGGRELHLDATLGLVIRRGS